MENIRNFCIIAHIDHGKSTLADRLLERTDTIKVTEGQMLDDMDLERERGITIKSHAIQMEYEMDGQRYILNLIDTPGHVDFAYEVSRSIAACEGALLVVDATQGVQAQTISNLYMAIDNDLVIIPVVNKCDMPNAMPEEVTDEIVDLLGCDPSEVILASGKTGQGVDDILRAVVERIPHPVGGEQAPLQALIFDSVFNSYRGVIAYFKIVNGVMHSGEKVRFINTKKEYMAEEIGVLKMDMIPREELRTGDVGYIVSGIKNAVEVKVGDTITSVQNASDTAIEGFEEVKPMVFAGVYPIEAEDYENLRASLEKLQLNDASLTFQHESSAALGFGFRCGFLGLLHMEIVQERLDREFDMNVITTVPNVSYMIYDKHGNAQEVHNPSSMPDPTLIEHVEEPYIHATIITAATYIGPIMTLCLSKRGELVKQEFIAAGRVEIQFLMPLGEIVIDFYDKLKSISRGYASFDYHSAGFRPSKLVKLDILLNGESVDALSTLTHADNATTLGRRMCERLKDLLPRQQFDIAIQAAIGGKIIARETVKQVRKDVLAKCYGGDVSRKRKLLEKQKAGKKRMKQIGNVQVPQKAFLAVLKLCFLVVPLICNANPITPERAALLAARYMKTTDVQPRLVKAAPRKKGMARLSMQARQSSPYYIFSRGDDCGFVIVSGDDALPEVLGYTEQGDYDENEMPPFLAWYLDYYGTAVEDAQANAAPRMAPAATATSGRHDIAPMIETHWHQDSPYNDKCPLLKKGGRSLTGCVATAASQVLYYWRKDLTTVTLAAISSYTYGDEARATTAFPSGTKIKWDLMRTQYSSEPAEYRDAVATLMAVVGGGARLTYGSSTGGYPDDCRWVFSSVFGMKGGTHRYKDRGGADEISDNAWMTLLYEELDRQHPILYAGCREWQDSDGQTQAEGHAIVIDGYQASTGYFHFNMGWGNPSSYDGYFTVARSKSPSWGFNDSWQECVTGVTPTKQNMTVEMAVEPKLYFNRACEVSIDIQNKGTLDYKGIYVFTNTNGAAPRKLTDAKASDTETILPNTGETTTITLTVHPTTSGPCYVIVTDANLNVLAKTETEALIPDADINLTDMMIDGSSDTEIHDGCHYTVVYNTKASAVVTFTDKSGLGYEGSPRLAIYESTDNGQTFSYVGYKSAKLSVEPNGTTDVTFSLTSTTSCPIKIGNLYYATLVNPIAGTKTDDEVNMEGAADTIMRFVLKGSDMAVESYDNGCLKLTGTWDVNAFTTLARKTAYKNATTYDLTAVDKISRLPVVENNPNALFYVASDAMPTGNNYVRDGICHNLNVQPGFDFMPRDDMKATSATIDIQQQPGKWCILTMPFDAEVSQGIVARQIDSHASSGISNKTTDMTQLKAGHAYLVMTSSTHRQSLVGHDVNVSKSPLANADTALVGTFSATVTPAGAMLIGDAEPQYFEPVSEATPIHAMRGYFYAENVTKSFRAYSQLASDPTFLTLAKQIDTAYTALDNRRRFASDESVASLTAAIDSAEIVFSDRTNTAAQARAATETLEATLRLFLAEATDPDAPIDCTAAIANPSFETGKTTGWNTDGTIQSATNLTYKSIDADGKYYLYNCNKDSTSSELSQTITGLTPGRYRLSAMLGSTEEHTITLFANDTTTTVKAHNLGVHYMVKAVINDVVVDESGELTIGVKAGFFYKADDFRLFLTKAAETRPTADVNGDGVVDTQDVLMIYECMQNSDTTAASACDANGDGVVDTHDVLKVYESIH